MTLVAGEYYAAMAVRNGVAANTIPPILSGEPVPLLAPDTDPNLTQVHKGHEPELATASLVEAYTEILATVGAFSVACACKGKGKIPKPQLDPRSEAHIYTRARKLLVPPKMTTGVLSDYYIQAVVPETDIAPFMIQKMTNSHLLMDGKLGDRVKDHLFLVTGANIRKPGWHHPVSTSIMGRVAFLTAVHTEGTRTVVYQSTTYTDASLKNGVVPWATPVKE